MGKLKITGKAVHEYRYDWTIIKIEFHGTASTASEALNRALEQCEDFLKKIRETGLDSRCIRSIGDEVIKDRYRETEKTEALREIRIAFPFSMETTNLIMDLVSSNSYDVKIRTDYKLKELAAIHDSLIKEAISDSRQKAEMYAESMGQKVTGIESMIITNRDISGPDPEDTVTRKLL